MALHHRSNARIMRNEFTLLMDTPVPKPLCFDFSKKFSSYVITKLNSMFGFRARHGFFQCCVQLISCARAIRDTRRRWMFLVTGHIFILKEVLKFLNVSQSFMFRSKSIWPTHTAVQRRKAVEK
ncbi:unnamed protein product, partial [Nesidiocoris tenuis]